VADCAVTVNGTRKLGGGIIHITDNLSTIEINKVYCCTELGDRTGVWVGWGGGHVSIPTGYLLRVEA
jgi:hypothetical protein